MNNESHQGRANLILIHGWGYDNSCWPDGLVTQLERQFNVILLALPGHGGTSDYVIEAGDTGDCVDQLDRWLSAIKPQLPDRYHILAWSLGGQVAIRLAHNNTHVERLVLLATNPKFVRDNDWRHGMPLNLLMQFVKNYQTQASKTMRRFASLQASGCDQNKTLAAHMVTQMAPETSKLLGLKLLHALDERAHLVGLTIPCLIELARDDQLIPTEWVADLALPLSSKVNVVAGGHGYVLQNHHLAARIIEFLTVTTTPVSVAS